MTGDQEKQPPATSVGADTVDEKPAREPLDSGQDMLLFSFRFAIWLFLVAISCLFLFFYLIEPSFPPNAGPPPNIAKVVVFLCISVLILGKSLGNMRRKKCVGWFLLAQMLTVIIMPNCMEGKRRSRYLRVHSDLRAVARALEAYAMDYNSYPPWTLDPEKKVYFSGGADMPTFQEYAQNRPATLRRPVTYITSYPLDAYHVENTYGTFAYWAPKEGGWILVSPGPDRRFDLDWPTLQKAYDPTSPNPAAGLIPYTYDPTNGTESRGDVWMIKR